MVSIGDKQRPIDPNLGVANAMQVSDYQMLFQQDVPADGVDDRAMCVAPLCYWLCDRLDPERVLTIGAGCELLHITMCEKAQNHVMQASCVHVAERFSGPFLEARKAYGSAKSQVIVPDPSIVRQGVEGQFDLIFLFASAPLSQGTVESWKAALSADGLLVICSEADGDLPVCEGLVQWQVGAQFLGLLSPLVADGRITAAAQVGEALKAGHSSLSNALAASMVDLTLRSKNALRDQYEKQTADMQKRQAADIISVTKKLAQIEQENIALRADLKAKTARLDALEPELVAEPEV